MSAQADAVTVQESTVTARDATALRARMDTVRGRASPLLDQSTTKTIAATRRKGAVDMTEEGPALGHLLTSTAVTPNRMTRRSPSIGTIVKAVAGQSLKTQGSTVAGIKRTMTRTKRLKGSLVKGRPCLKRRSFVARASHL